MEKPLDMCMSPAELGIVQILTLAIAFLAALLAYMLFKKYREIPALPSLSLMLYFLMLAINYALIFLFRFPNAAESFAMSCPAIVSLAFVLGRSKPLFSAMFGIYTIDQRRWKAISIVPALVTLAIITLILLYPPYNSYTSPRFMEWVMGRGANAAIWLSIAMTLIAPICFLAYALVVKDRKRRTKASIIAFSFFALAFLMDFQEPLGAFMPLTLRRALVLITMAVLYAGFTM